MTFLKPRTSPNFPVSKKCENIDKYKCNSAKVQYSTNGVAKIKDKLSSQITNKCWVI